MVKTDTRKPRVIYKWAYPPLPDVPVTSDVAVLVIATGERGKIMFTKWGNTCASYATSVKADFILVRETANPNYRYLDKFVIGPLLEKYKRVVYIDADVEVLPGAPNLFELVPENIMGLIDERMYYCNEGIERGIERVAEIGKEHGYTFYPSPGRYLSTGIMVVSRMHKDIFRLPEIPFIRTPTYEQDLIFARILEAGHRAMYFGPELQYVHGFGVHGKEHAKFHHYPGVIPYEDQ